MNACEDSWIYQEGIEKGIEKGVEQGIEQGIEQERARLRDRIIARSRERFGPNEVGEERIRRIDDLDTLLDLYARLGSSAALADALAGLG